MIIELNSDSAADEHNNPVRRPATPCVGICSTTYGDLVCRGCKRFAHEVRGWNGYSHEQQEAIWTRLKKIRGGCVTKFVEIVDPDKLARVTEGRVAPDETMPMRALEVIKNKIATLSQSGLRIQTPAGDLPERLLFDAIEREFYVRSCAEYERSFEVVIE